MAQSLPLSASSFSGEESGLRQTSSSGWELHCGPGVLANMGQRKTHISSSHPCRKTDRPCPAHPHDFVPAYGALGLTPPSRTEELPQDAESCAHVAHGPGTLGGARMDGVKVPRLQSRGQALGSGPGTALPHRLSATSCWPPVLACPGYPSPRVQPGLLKRNLSVPQFALTLHCSLP